MKSLEELRPLIAERISLMKDDVVPYIEQEADDVSTQMLDGDVERYKKDLEGVEVNIYRKVTAEDGHSSAQPFKVLLMVDYVDLLELLISELEAEVERRNDECPMKKQIYGLIHANQEFRAEVDRLEAENERLKAQTDKKSESVYERAAEDLIAKAKSIAGAEARIRAQWQEEREKVSEDRRRDIDRIYHSILEQFREKL